MVQHHDDPLDVCLEDAGEGAVHDAGAQLRRDVPLVVGKGADPVGVIGCADEVGMATDALYKVLEAGAPAVANEVVNRPAPPEVHKGHLLPDCQRSDDVRDHKMHVSLQNDTLEVLPELRERVCQEALVLRVAGIRASTTGESEGTGLGAL